VARRVATPQRPGPRCELAATSAPFDLHDVDPVDPDRGTRW
jgi:hypothetical protein